MFLFKQSLYCFSKHRRFFSSFNQSILVYDERTKKQISSISPETIGLKLFYNFVNEKEESSLVEEVNPIFNKKKYETSHWDKVITGYRELEKMNWKEENRAIFNRIKLQFPEISKWQPSIHVLDLSEKGVIGPHIDSVKFSGGIVTGLSLLSPSIMRLRFEKPNECKIIQHLDEETRKHVVIDMMLLPRSLYALTQISRYDCTHEIFLVSKQTESLFSFASLPEQTMRRIALILRDEPPDEQNPFSNMNMLIDNKYK